MSAQYYTLVTDIGLAKLANALALGQVITLTHFAVGDGNGAVYDPVQSASALKREVYRAPINTILTDPATPTWLTIEAVIPATVGGWTVREAGVFDADGDLIVIAKYPESVKPALESGVGKDLYCRLILDHSNVSTVTLKIDPAVVLATRAFVADAVAAGIATHAAAAGAHPDATTTVKGFVELATPTETKAGTSTSLAVTPKGLADTLGDLTTEPQFDAGKRAATTEFVQRALGSLAGAVAFGVDTVLDKTAVGKIIGPTVGGLTFTLPPSADAPPGAQLRFNGNGFGLTIARSGADLIVTPPNSVTTFALGALDSAVFRRSTGGGAWILDEGSAFLKYTSAFAAVLGGLGYQRLPSGWIVQMGTVTTTSGGGAVFAFPIPFPSARLCEAVGAVPGNYTITGAGGGASSRSYQVLNAATGAAAPAGLSFQAVVFGN